MHVIYLCVCVFLEHRFYMNKREREKTNERSYLGLATMGLLNDEDMNKVRDFNHRLLTINMKLYRLFS
jgi:hypothetical protein